MCLIAWNWQPGTSQPLLLLANRDKFYDRPSEPIHWLDGGEILAGRDLTAGGTWLGITRNGRLAALTNYRDPNNFRVGTPSHGALVTNFLRSTLSAHDYLHSVLPEVADYNAFNLLVFDCTHLMRLEIRHSRLVTFEAGIGAVSNADFLSPWPTLEKLRIGLAKASGLMRPERDINLWNLLRDGHQAQDDLLPKTGIPLQREKDLSSAFIATPD